MYTLNCRNSRKYNTHKKLDDQLSCPILGIVLNLRLFVLQTMSKIYFVKNNGTVMCWRKPSKSNLISLHRRLPNVIMSKRNLLASMVMRTLIPSAATPHVDSTSCVQLMCFGGSSRLFSSSGLRSSLYTTHETAVIE